MGIAHEGAQFRLTREDHGYERAGSLDLELDKNQLIEVRLRHKTAADMSSMRRFTSPVPGYREQDFHHVMASDGDGFAYCAMINRRLYGGLGLFVRFNTGSLPYLNEWKMMVEIGVLEGSQEIDAFVARVDGLS